MYNLYHCCRCNETFWRISGTKKFCPSCGNDKISKKEITFDIQNKSTTINNVTHGLKEDGLVKINISGERRKGCFSCNRCGTVFEADCTEGLQVVSCPNCHQKDFESKSPIVSVIGGVAGLPPIKQNWTKKEIKKMKFAKSCYTKRLELENMFNKILSLMNALEIPEENKVKLEIIAKDSISFLEKYHEEKIKNYGS